MKPRPQALPEPKTREEALSLLWAFLKARLKERRLVTGVGESTTVQHRMPGANGYEENFHWSADVPLDQDGRLLLCGVLHACPDSLEPDPKTLPLLLDVVHDLERQGILRPSWVGGMALYITHHGAKVLDTDDLDLPPGDAARVGRLKAEFAALSDIDPIAKHYGEAIAAYAVNLDYSATVMIGVCYEAGLLTMARGIAAYQGRTQGDIPGMNKNHRNTTAKVDASEYVAASSVEGVVYDVLCALGTRVGDDLGWVRTCLRPTCVFVRTLRNSAGHPTGKAVTRDDIAAHILLLPAFLRHVVSVNAAVARCGSNSAMQGDQDSDLDG